MKICSKLIRNSDQSTSGISEGADIQDCSKIEVMVPDVEIIALWTYISEGTLSGKIDFLRLESSFQFCYNSRHIQTEQDTF